MEISQPHDWNVSIAAAMRIQKNLREKIVLTDQFDSISTVAGIDVGISTALNRARAAIILLNLEDLSHITSAVVEGDIRFPYIPGFLSFREIPIILKAFKKLPLKPDLLICDGQGTAHPRRFGIACHLGILTDIPTIGVGKTRLIGLHGEVPSTKGGWVPLTDRNEVIGGVLRTREKVKPVYVSPGHNISLESAINLVMKSVTRFRLPETTRKAHRLASFSSLS